MALINNPPLPCIVFSLFDTVNECSFNLCYYYYFCKKNLFLRSKFKNACFEALKYLLNRLKYMPIFIINF